MLLCSTCYYNGNPFFLFTLTPTTTGVCFRWVWSVVVFYLTWFSIICIVLVTAVVVVTISWVNPLSQLFMPCFYLVLVLSRFTVGRVLHLTCIPLPLAWWHEHDVTNIAKWCGQASSWLLAIWLSLIAKSLLAIWQSCIAKALLMIWRSCIPKCTLANWRLYIALSLLTTWHCCITKWC